MNRKMKDSGVEWIGEIPEGWAIERGKHILTYLERPIFPEAGVVTCFRDGEVTLRANRREDGFTVALKEIGYKGVAVGDLVVHGMDGFAGAIGISDSCGKCSPVLNILDSTQNKRFLMYYLRNMAYGEVFSGLATGIRQRSCDTGWNKLRTLDYVLPPIREQQRIADYLDTRTAEIDASIAKTQESIEEYKKLKQAVITQAVTKGIRPGRTMKDSGVEWWPYISEDCEITRIGRVCTIILGKMLTPQSRAESDTIEPYFCAANVHFGRVDDVEGLKRMWFSPREKDDYLVIDGDMLVVEGGAGAGGAAIVKRLSTPAYIQNSIMIVRGGTLCDNRYVCYALESLVKRGYIDIACNKATIPHFTKEKLSATCIPYWSKEEQQEIAAYLDEKCAAIDTLIEKKQQIITELEAYKKSLIYEYVTGKKEVPTAT